MLVYAHHSMDTKRKIIVVAGPTASGKSDFAVELALKMSGEIISADSRQIYRGLDVGTGKITKEEMKGIPHHMLDIIDVGDSFSVAEYARMAKPIIEDIFSRGKTPIICGGTGQYIDALIYDNEPPRIPPDATLREELEQKSASELFSLLSEKDPRRASTIDPHNKVRLVRALEIAEALGAVPPLEEATLLYETEFYLMHPTRDVLRGRVVRRLEKRLQMGMIDEVKRLMDQGFRSDKMKRFGLEYVTIAHYLEGTLTEDEMKTELTNKIMQYARRQDTWNKKYLPFAKLVDVR